MWLGRLRREEEEEKGKDVLSIRPRLQNVSIHFSARREKEKKGGKKKRAKSRQFSFVLIIIKQSFRLEAWIEEGGKGGQSAQFSTSTEGTYLSDFTRG